MKLGLRILFDDWIRGSINFQSRSLIMGCINKIKYPLCVGNILFINVFEDFKMWD